MTKPIKTDENSESLTHSTKLKPTQYIPHVGKEGPTGEDRDRQKKVIDCQITQVNEDDELNEID